MGVDGIVDTHMCRSQSFLRYLLDSLYFPIYYSSIFSQHIPQYGVQDTAVAIIIHFNRRIDPDDGVE